MTDPVVWTSRGAVRGAAAANAGVAVFRGIPYAAPPFGEHRLAAPAPVPAWDGIRDATAFSAQPPQSPLFPGMPEWSPANGLDCLGLNVWTPDPGGAGLPVLVWVYGGAYRSGSADLAEYDGSLLAASGVVVVTFNYRVGFEGFGHVAGAPANRAFLDQVAALTWVRDNIAGFGGDPGQVTVFGESAGAGSVAALLAMPSARGLFRRAIAQSVPGTYFSAALATRIGAAIARRLGVPATARALAARPPEELVRVSDAFTDEELTGHPEDWGPLAHTPTAFSPVVDGEVLPDTPWNALAAGAASGVELISGFNRDEFRLFVATSPAADRLTDDHFKRAAELIAPPGAEAVYRAAHPAADAAELYTVLMSDWLFRMPSERLARAHTAGGGVAYAYELTWQAPGLGGVLGACHALDVPLTFGTLDAPLAALLLDRSAGTRTAVEELSLGLRTAWTRFAATGDPGWPRFDPLTATTHVFDVPASDAADPEAVSRRLWENHPFDPIG